LLDAGPIIGLHELALWQQFTQLYDVAVSETVLSQEALFHSRDELSGFHERIDLERDSQNRMITTV
jgi:hypothetical protein